MAEYTGALPTPTPETKPYWDALKEHRLLIQRCKECQRAYFYPRPFCPQCFSFNVEWFEASGQGKLYSFVINHRPAPGFGPEPYVIAVVELDEGPRMMTNLIDVEPDPDKISCDMPVRIVYEDVTTEITLPKFRPA
ncbi:MAG: Zn-ribbon domain-containing OB-fold protein [Chloroflexi bacterium]|nr:Zn-ribbon domain-containing OB-fold protein [Chloroflexota bacterium]